MADKKHDFHYGGQAVIEGVMMRGPKDFAVAVRRANGEIVSTVENVESKFAKLAWLKKPFLRGTLALIDAMALGIKALKYATDIAMADISASEAGKTTNEAGAVDAGAPTKPAKGVNDIAVGAIMVLGLLGGLAIFFLVPIVFTKLLKPHMHTELARNAVEMVIKLGIFVGYVAAISLLKDIQRVFMYHGAEHKTINAYEAGEELTVENVRRYSKVHVRCGTSFILVVLMVGMVVNMLVVSQLPYGSLTDGSILARWLYKLALLPAIAGIAYEIIRMAGNCKDSILTKLVLLPGLLMQKLTTREPDDAMIEVAITSLKGVFDKEAADSVVSEMPSAESA